MGASKKGAKRTAKFRKKGGIDNEIAKRRKRQKLLQRQKMMKVKRNEKRMDRAQTAQHKNKGAPTSLLGGGRDERRSNAVEEEEEEDEEEEEEEESSSDDADAAVAGVRSAKAASVDDLFGAVGAEASGAASGAAAAHAARNAAAKRNNAEDDDDEEEEEEEDDEAMDMDAHRKQLEALAKSDPEFHKFLAENDEEMLAFGEGGSDEEDEMASRIALAAAAEDAAQERAAPSDGSAVVLTSATFRGIARAALEKHTLKGLQNLLHAFHTAVRELDSFAPGGGGGGGGGKKRKRKGGKGGEEEEEEDEGATFNAKYRILSSSVFDAVITTTLGEIHTALEHHLQWSPSDMASSNSNPRLPCDSATWKRMRPCVVSLLRSLLRLLLEMSQAGIVLAVVENLHTLLPFISCLIVADDVSNPEQRKHARLVSKLLKVLVNRWAAGASGVVHDKASAQADLALRTHCFHRIREFAACAIALGTSRVQKRRNGAVAKKLTDEFVELCLKQSYLAFVAYARTMNVATEGIVLLLRNCLCELYAGLDLGLAYQLAFVYIRQLALYLRKAVVNKPSSKKGDGRETRHQKSQSVAAAQDAKKVYTWQYGACVFFYFFCFFSWYRFSRLDRATCAELESPHLHLHTLLRPQCAHTTSLSLSSPLVFQSFPVIFLPHSELPQILGAASF